MTTNISAGSGRLNRPFEYKLLAYATMASAGVLGFSAPAAADFSGYFDVSNWTTTLTNSDGTVDTSGAPTGVVVIGNDGGGAGDTDFTIAAAADGIVSFDWTYTSGDSGCFDSGGFLLNGAYTLLACNDGTPTGPNGTFSSAVATGDVFGFRVHSADGIFGAGFLSIRNFDGGSVGQVPEPGTLALLAAGLLGAVSAARRGKRREPQPTLN